MSDERHVMTTEATHIDPRIIPTAYGKYLALSRKGDADVLVLLRY